MDFKPQDSIGFLMRQAFWSIKNSMHQKLRQHGYKFTMEQGGALMRLWMKDGQSQTELAEFLGKDKTTIARLINSMEKSLLVVRIPGKEDKRINLIYLTQKGKEVQQEVMKCIQHTLNEALDGVSAKDEETSKKVLKKIYKNLGTSKLSVDQSNEECN